MNVFEFQNYRDVLRAELAQRMQRNPRYSLRALAKDLDMGSSTLSEVLSGKINISLERARKIAASLKMRSSERSYFFELVQLAHTKDLNLKLQIAENLKKRHPKKIGMHDLSLEHFKQMSDWYHAAILELPQIPNQDLAPKAIAEQLQITKPEAEMALSRLLKLGLLTQSAEGVVGRNPVAYKVKSEVRNEAMRNYYRQMLERVNTAIQEQTPQERLSGYLNLAISSKALPEIDEAIDRLFAEIKAIAAKHEDRENVYHLSLHFINMTKGKSK